MGGILAKTTREGEPVTRSPTVRECLAHRSGLYSNPDFFKRVKDAQVKKEMIRAVRDISWSLEECVEQICERPFSAQPGSQYDYSCAGFFLAGRCLELSAKRSMDEIIEKEVCGPLGMNQTTFFPKSSGDSIAVPGATTAQAIRSFFGATRNREWQEGAHQIEGRPKLASPSMGLYSTATDLGRVARMMLNRGRIDDHEFISEESWKDMISKQADDSPCGLSWGLHFEDGVVTAISHSGSGGGCKCSIRVDLKNKTYLVAAYTLRTVAAKEIPARIRLALAGRRSLGASFDPKRTDEGLFVKSLVRTFPAQNAGIRFGDRIVKMDGQAVNSVEECDRAVEEADHGLDVEVLRAGKTIALEVRFDK